MNKKNRTNKETGILYPNFFIKNLNNKKFVNENNKILKKMSASML